MPPESVPLQSWLKRAEARLRSGPHPERARADAELLLLHLIGRDRAFLIAHPEKLLAAGDAARYDSLIERRFAGEPVQYITGEQEFFGLPLHVTPDVLIPRPETEHLVEKALELATFWPRPRIVDVGCGSGAIAVALAHALPAAEVTAIDLSPAALEVAKQNAARHRLGKIRFLEGDLLGPVEESNAGERDVEGNNSGNEPEGKPSGAERFELVVSNPPYVARADRDALAIEVRDYEPELALFAGDDGLDVYRKLIPAAFRSLVSGGAVLLEIGCGQQDAVRMLLEAAGFQKLDFICDLRGIPRVAIARRDSFSQA